jgi:hypothetical protein
MGLFDDPEMQLIGFEQSGINTAKHFAPQQDKMGLLHPPSLDIKLDTLSGAPTRYIHWGPGGNDGGMSSMGDANIDPTMAKFFRGSQLPGLGSPQNPRSTLLPSLINLSPDQEPELRHQQWLRAMQLYRDMTPEQIRQLHYTDAQSFPATSDSDLNHKARMSQEADAFLTRQKEIQEFRIGNPKAQKIAGNLEILGAQQRIAEVAKWGDERNSIYLANLKKYIKENPGLGDALDRKMMTPESFVKKYGVAITTDWLPGIDEGEMKRRRQKTLDLIDQWGKVTKKHGLSPERYTPGGPGRNPPKFGGTGGFLLGVLGNAGELGMFGRLLKGGTPMIAGDGSEFDVMLPGEMSVIENAKKMGRGVFRNSEGVLEESPYTEFEMRGEF